MVLPQRIFKVAIKRQISGASVKTVLSFLTPGRGVHQPTFPSHSKVQFQRFKTCINRLIVFHHGF
jgi:hypothetical protein